MDHDKTTGCQPPPEHPVLCINNCGFFGSAATMNMCSKCHKDMSLKQEQHAKLAFALNTTSTNNVADTSVDVQLKSAEPKGVSVQPSSSSSSSPSSGEIVEAKPKEGPNRCNTCNKRTGLTGFRCRCGNLFCGSHRYSDKHDCPFDYHSAARDAIAKANPVVKAEKLEKI